MKIYNVELANIWVYDLDAYLASEEESKQKYGKDRIELLTKRAAVLETVGITIIQSSRAKPEKLEEWWEPWSKPSFPCTADQYIQLVMLGESPTIKASIESNGAEAIIARLGDVVSKAEATLLGGHSEANWNGKCEVHMPGHAMSSYNETMLLTDSCTDELQGVLNDGWRIIAVCPQPDQRRPDYILGRWNPDHDSSRSRANRGR